MTYPASGHTYTKLLYNFDNVPINATGSTGSGNFDVSNFYTKSAYAYIGTQTAASGSLIISGSFDRVHYYTFLSGSFLSGSVSYYTFTDAIPFISVNLYNHVTGSAISGSLFLDVA